MAKKSAPSQANLNRPEFRPGFPKQSVTPSVSQRVEVEACRFLARGARTESQFQAFLVRKGASAQEIHTLLSQYREKGYLDDAAFAVRWGQARLRRYPMGRNRLVEEVCAKGIDRSQAEQAVAEVFAHRTEVEMAERLLARRFHGGVQGHEREALGLLRRRGFDEEVIGRVVAWDPSDCAILS